MSVHLKLDVPDPSPRLKNPNHHHKRGLANGTVDLLTNIKRGFSEVILNLRFCLWHFVHFDASRFH
jgi:hypothetical protein